MKTHSFPFGSMNRIFQKKLNEWYEDGISLEDFLGLEKKWTDNLDGSSLYLLCKYSPYRYGPYGHAKAYHKNRAGE